MDNRLHVVSLTPLSATAQDSVKAVDPSVELTVAAGWFDGELADTWGEYVATNYLRSTPSATAESTVTRAERDALLADADVVVGGFPPLVDLRARAPKLRWFHQTPAGASNLRRCDLWGGDVPVTTSRGLNNALAIAEYVVGTFLYFARGFDQAFLDRQAGAPDRAAYRPVLLAGKTVCVIGAGGIGQEVGRLCAALGMRVVGTRNNVAGQWPDGFDDLGGPERLLELLSEANYVAVCCQWTPETQDLINAEALAALPGGAVVTNVARGEIIDEVALLAAIDRLRGVALDVYVGEFEHPPPAGLWEHPKVLMTPHVSVGAEARTTRPMELFCENLAALLEGRALQNRIDWSRGY